jgi:hypothetical protein
MIYGSSTIVIEIILLGGVGEGSGSEWDDVDC